MTKLHFDSEVSRQVESVYVTPDVIEQRRAVRAVLALRPGERVLDIGVGPGLLAAEAAAEVGPDGRVCGIDISDSMLAIAATRSKVAGSAPLELRNADTNHVPYPDGGFDVVVSTQVFEYVADIPGALAEVRRVLRPGGRVLLLDTDWDSIVWHSTDDERMTRVLHAFEEHLVDPHLPRTLKGALERAGFEVDPPRILPLFNVGYDRATYSAGMLEIIARFVTARGALTTDEVDAWTADLRGLGPDYFFSINRYLFLAAKPA
jgi:SAM-dependent methyltransferase